ncbi:MAG: hypothetical protein ABIT71_12850 [Vicinamibacteraceae bacterium]
MATLSLQDFILANRDELIGRCRTKVRARSAPPVSELEINHGVPIFLDQLVEELKSVGSRGLEMKTSAAQHGHDMLAQRFTVGQVVHDYGDVCQSVTDLAVEKSSPISTDDFRTLNRCLDNAIAGAVSQFSHEQSMSTGGSSAELHDLVRTALTAFEALQTGSVGVNGRTGDLVLRSLKQLAEILGRSAAGPAQGDSERV